MTPTARAWRNGPLQALVLYAADHGIDPAYMRAARGWTEQEWDAAPATGDRAAVERVTDLAAAEPWLSLGAGKTTRLAELLQPVALRIASRNEAMRVNPMALDPVRELAVPGWNT